MPDDVIIVDAQGTEHHFPAGFDPKQAGAIVRRSTAGPTPEGWKPPSAADMALADNPAMPALLRGGMALGRTAKAHPAQAGAIAGGLLASPVTGGMSAIPAIALTGLASAGGAGYGLAADQLSGGKYRTEGENALTMGKEGALAAGGEGAGRAIQAGLRGTGRLMYRTALSPRDPVLKKYGDVVGEGLATRTPVSKTGLGQAVETKAARMAVKDTAMKAADQKVGFLADQIANDAAGPLSTYATKQVRAGLPDPTGDISERLAQFTAANPKGSLTPSSLDEVKGTLDDLTGLAYRKIRMREPLTATEKTSVEMARAMSRANEGAVPGYKAMNRGIMDAEGLRKAIETRTLGSGGNQVLDTLLAINHPAAGIPARIAMMPPVMSRAGIATHMAGQTPVPSASLKAALIALLGGSPDAP